MTVTAEDIRAAATRIAPAIVRTPLLRSDVLDDMIGARVFVKAECLQRYGAFKIRGAYNKVASLTPAERQNGVVAFSSGNHGIGVAGAARAFDIPAAIVMPADTPAAKTAQIERLGGEIVPYDRLTEDRFAIAAVLSAKRGMVLVPPFDDPAIIAGQGTIGFEIAEQLAEVNLAPDIVLTGASGGGLATGIATALSAAAPQARVFVVEPEEHDDFGRSLKAGTHQRNAPGVRSICDALLVETPGKITFEIAQRLIAGAYAVSDEEALRAMAFYFAHLKIVVEPSGAVGLAAAIKNRDELAGKLVVIVASGGNVDPAMFQRALTLP
jgi:threonine dehydratase